MSSSSTTPQSHPSVSVLSEVFAGEKEDTKLSLCAEVGQLANTELDSLILNITHKLITNQNLIIISQSSSSSSSSVAAPQSCLNMTELRRLLKEEKEASKVSFRADFNRRVESQVESLFKRMTNKCLDLDLTRLDSGNGAAVGDRAQAVDSADGRTESSHPPRVSLITQPSTCSSSIGQSCPFKTQPMGPVCNCPHPPKRTVTDVLPEVKEEEEEDTSNRNSAGKDMNTQLMVSKVKEEEDEDDHSQVDDERYEVTQPNVDCGQLLSNPSKDRKNDSNANESIEEGGTNLSSQQLLNTLNEPNEVTTVTQSADLLSPSTSTAQDETSRTALNQQARTVSTQDSKRKQQQTSNRTGKRSKITLLEEDGDDEEGGEDIVNEGREEAKIKVLYLNCTQSNCTVKLDSMDHLKDHLSTVHKLSPLLCFAQNCDARFDHPQQMSAHNKQHHSQDTLFLCPVCHQEYDSQTQAYLHWYLNHLTGQFECNLVNDCAEMTDTRGKMKTHQQTAHYSQSKHLHCTHPGCTASFTYNVDLKRHQQTHLDSKPFHCNWAQCNFRTNRRASLVTHIRMKHFGLPKSVKEQMAENIEDDRDPNEYVRVVVDE